MVSPIQIPRSPTVDLTRFGFLATRSQVRASGTSERTLQRAISAGELLPIGRSWVANAGADRRAMRAVALRGRLAASSALSSYGVWVTRDSGLWIAHPRSASRLPPLAMNEQRLWTHEFFPCTSDTRWRVSVHDALLQAVKVESANDAIASFDSALNQGLVTRADVDGIFACVPRRVRRLRRRLSARADSGLETLMRLAAEDEGWQVEAQVMIAGVGYVDLLINGWLVIELDGSLWHDDEASGDKDAHRNAQLVLLGYRWHRFRYRQVMHDLPRCIDVIRALLSGGRPMVRTGSVR
ncbi:endonuclease domain-containing protein [Homoserinimonas sp. OAct 916]|uniref:endonuclease domain-containing protein n=1 Tax=Homoserinimonas sp. OAct 916 TaxID=2211450 RepID=UPI000DBEA013|nr:DUF559 domain-containing protein [Homoserinimonas sp. OAct 916]